jgi:predicted ABC-class ATPase
MNQLKSLLYQFHEENKENLRLLYQDRHIYDSHLSSSEQPIEDEKIFYFKQLSLRFRGTGFRKKERLTMLISIPFDFIKNNNNSDNYKVEDQLITAYEDYLLRILAPKINLLSESYENDKKDSREKAHFSAQIPSEVILRRNGMVWDERNNEFKLRIQFFMPLINGTGINAKKGFRAIKELMELVSDELEHMSSTDLYQQVNTYWKQLQMRKYLKENHFVSFLANDSILPRDGSSVLPSTKAIPFQSPHHLWKEIKFEDGTTISGMAIPCGITVITGGGYSGKSTLLDAIEMGIYNHRLGDGREYVITDESAIKIYAEDGRIVHPLDLSPFFTFVPDKQDVKHFHTPHASGSVSQAANIIEAVYSGSKLFLIDEDKSATNFMIRDSMMRRIVEKEPIIPFTDRVRDLSTEKGISTILVIGGSSEYLKYADIILLMEDYVISDISNKVFSMQEFNIKRNPINKSNIHVTEISNMNIAEAWMKHRHLLPQKRISEFAVSKCIQINQSRYIKIDTYISDITMLTALISNHQVNALAWLLEHLLTDENSASEELLRKINDLSRFLERENIIDTVFSSAYDIEPWLEDIRSLEIVGAIHRMRDIELI